MVEGIARNQLRDIARKRVEEGCLVKVFFLGVGAVCRHAGGASGSKRCCIVCCV